MLPAEPAADREPLPKADVVDALPEQRAQISVRAVAPKSTQRAARLTEEVGQADVAEAVDRQSRGGRGIVGPIAKRVSSEIDVQVARIVRHLGAEPARLGNDLLLVGQLDFGDDESRIRTPEDVDLPGDLAVGQAVPRLFDRATGPHRREDCLRVDERDLVLVLRTGDPDGCALDREEPSIAGPT